VAERIRRNRVDHEEIERLLTGARLHVAYMLVAHADGPSRDEIDAMEPPELRAIAEAVLATPEAHTHERKFARQVLVALERIDAQVAIARSRASAAKSESVTP
jgi:hypothetical protein